MTTKSNINGPKAIGHMESSIGTLYIFSLTLGLQSKFYNEIGKPLSECDPSYLIRMLSMFVCYPKDSLWTEDRRPKEVILTRADVETLTNEDINEIARIYLEGNDYLFRESIRKENRNSEGNIVVSYEKGNIEYPREEGESYVQYLGRLLKHQEEKHINQLKKLAEPFSHFSASLRNSIGETMAWGESLKKSLLHATTADTRVVPEMMPGIDFAELRRSVEQARLKPFNELSSRLDQLIEMTG